MQKKQNNIYQAYTIWFFKKTIQNKKTLGNCLLQLCIFKKWSLCFTKIIQKANSEVFSLWFYFAYGQVINQIFHQMKVKPFNKLNKTNKRMKYWATKLMRFFLFYHSLIEKFFHQFHKLWERCTFNIVFQFFRFLDSLSISNTLPTIFQFFFSVSH